MKKLLVFIVCLTMCMALVSVSFALEHEGEYEGVLWHYKEGVMTFRGGIYMPQTDVPWQDYIKGTKTLVIGESFPERETTDSGDEENGPFPGYTLLREVVYETNYCRAAFPDSKDLKTAIYRTKAPVFLGAAYIGCRLDKVIFEDPEADYAVTGSFVMNKDRTELFYYLGSKSADIIIPDTVEVIHEGAFAGCNARNITLPPSIRIIEGWAFANSQIRSITIPASCEKIGKGAFMGCRALREVKFLCDHTEFYAESYGFQPGATVRKGGYTFSGCTVLREITLAGCDDIPDAFFLGCTDLRSVAFGEGTKNLTSNPEESRIFESCKRIKTVYIPDDMNFEKITFKDARYPVILCHEGSKAARLAYKYKMQYKYIGR